MGFCQRIRSEFATPLFGIHELDGTLDVNRSFQIGRGLLSWVGIAKASALSVAVATLAYAFSKEDFPAFYPAYLTPWGVFFIILELLGSFLLTACAPLSATPNILVKLTWAMHNVSCVIGCCITFLFWSLVYDPDDESFVLPVTIMVHGGVLLIAVSQGILVDRVPFRLKHGSFSALMAALLSGWLALHDTTVRYNPDAADSGRDDDSLYGAIRWREETTDAIVKTVLVIFVAVPVFAFLLWAIHLPGRRYLTLGNDDDDNDGREKVDEDRRESDAQEKGVAVPEEGTV